MEKCPYCAEEIQDEAIKCKHCGSWLDGREEEKKPIRAESPKVTEPSKQREKVYYGCLIVFIVLTALMVIGVIASKTLNNSPPSRTTSRGLHLGHTGRLTLPGGGDLLWAVSEQDLKLLTEALLADDKYGRLELMATKRVLLAPNETKIIIVDFDRHKVKFRFLEGEHRGSVGWIPREFVK